MVETSVGLVDRANATINCLAYAKRSGKINQFISPASRKWPRIKNAHALESPHPGQLTPKRIFHKQGIP
jgi:hypothetical protein